MLLFLLLLLLLLWYLPVLGQGGVHRQSFPDSAYYISPNTDSMNKCPLERVFPINDILHVLLEGPRKESERGCVRNQPRPMGFDEVGGQN